MVPFERDSQFVGREEILLQINELSKKEKRMALTGIGGVGKSQIAIEHCYRFRDEHPNSHVFWVNGSSAQRFEQHMQRFLGDLSSVDANIQRSKNLN